MRHVSYLDLRLRQPGDGGERLLHLDVGVLCGTEGPLQLAQLRFVESRALPAALDVGARPVRSIMVHCRERTTWGLFIDFFYDL